MTDDRRFRDITKEELMTKVDITFYYYILTSILDEPENEDERKEALEIAKENWDNRVEKTKEVLEIIKRNVEPDEFYSDFEDCLLEAIESVL